jgi:predicted SprT family Zn-dependent metalloprotease
MINKRLTEDQKNEIFNLVVETVERANRIYSIDMAIPMVEFKKLGRVAGYAIFDRNYIQYNDTLAAENFEDFKERTVIHEVAHLIDHTLHGIQRSGNGRRIIHGKTFKAIMVRLGADPSTYHSYDTTSVTKARNKYVWVNTEGQKLILGATRHRRMLASGGTHYWMRNHTCREYTYAS